MIQNKSVRMAHFTNTNRRSRYPREFCSTITNNIWFLWLFNLDTRGTMAPKKQSIAEFLKDLPCHHEQNFSLFNTENGIRTSLKRPSVYLPTDEVSPDQSEYRQTVTMIIFLIAFIKCSHCHREEEHPAALSTPSMGEEGSSTLSKWKRLP